ncbi:hypothetical protein [Parerythrobacter lacustris]|uniref:Uncharacterized protein n=1 Tax=Parerythrobacter lacustris TaxID=2969984 RepID=A0ABT1XTH3_9SPHN|nr:hypothetical protein [Parerythrobacter lacustris]MCR2834927.1 hypothetical protein [Parerythrobacter lacustris]
MAVLAACATPAPPPAPVVVIPPPPPVVKYVPPRPTPPDGATTGMYIPAADEYGIRRTVNYGLSSSQTVWNLRAALNVAALNCQRPEHAEILPAYSLLLERNKRSLSRTNTAVEGEFRNRHGNVWRDSLDDYMTQVYNYYALPPTQGEFCDTALAISREYMLTDGNTLDAFALASLPRIEQVFQRFYSAYEQYQRNVAFWDAEYAPPPPVLVNSFTDGAPQSGFAADTSTTVYTVDVAPSMPMSASQPVIVSQLPSSDPGVTYAPGAADGTIGVNPGFSLTAPDTSSSPAGPIVFESGEVVQQAPEPDEGQ